jgi:hypothetical protein
MLALMFALGLFLGMFLMAGGKWKRRYRDEVRRREELEREHERHLREHRESESLRHSAARAPITDRDVHDTRRGPL